MDNVNWISHTEFQNKINFFEIIDSHIKNNSESVLIIRGCNYSIKNTLEERGFYSLKIGSEALLDTSKNCFDKKSLTKLVARGLKKGKIEKLNYSLENAQKLSEFKKYSTHSKEPQLKNLFQTEFEKNHTLYVFKKNNIWLGAVLVSKYSNSKIHTELILRNKNSPVGTIEAIIQYIYSDINKQNIKFLSLGEVPFSESVTFIKDGFYSKIVNVTGKFLKFAYNFEGLKKFKSKFNPDWEPVYICFSKKISVKHLIFLLVKSNFHKLIFYKFIFTIKNDCFLKKF